MGGGGLYLLKCLVVMLFTVIYGLFSVLYLSSDIISGFIKQNS